MTLASRVAADATVHVARIALALLLALTAGIVSLGSLSPTSAAAAGERLIVPFEVGKAWYVCQGYNGAISHEGDLAFDLTPDTSRGPDGCWGNPSAAAGGVVVAPAAGTLHRTDDRNIYGIATGVCITFSSGGGSMYFGHIDNRRANGPVAQGDVIGRVAPPNTAGAGPYSHLHLSARSGAGCGGSKVPFTGSFRFTGMPDLPYAGGTVRNQHSGTKFVRTSGTTGGVPFGAFDTASSPANGQLKVTGWAIDPDAKTAPLGIHVYVGGPAGSGAKSYPTTADRSRPDVGRAHPGTGNNHGFDATFDLGQGGTYEIYVYALNRTGTPGTNPLLGTRRVTVGSPLPLGNIDEVRSPGPGLISVRGWAYDPDAKTTPLRVHAYVGAQAGDPTAEVHDLGPANASRPDVAATFAGVGRTQGLDKTFTTAKTGTFSVFFYAINAPGTSGSNPRIGQKTVTVSDPAPYGSFEEARSPYGGTVRVKGWAIDPNAATSASKVRISIGGPLGSPGTEQHLIAANLTRNDVAQAHPGTGTSHGFSRDIETKLRGSQPVHAYAVNVGPGQDRPLGSFNVDIDAPRALANTRRPVVKGVPKVGKTLRAVPGKWTAKKLEFRYQWRADGQTVSTSRATLKITKAMRGKRISVAVTATRPGHIPRTATSPKTPRVR